MSQNYTYGKNWTRGGNETFYNGNNEKINNPSNYFNAVSENKYGYNNTYSNGRGETINNPPAYYSTVAKDTYGYNSNGNSSKN
jgi:hypothetical protein